MQDILISPTRACQKRSLDPLTSVILKDNEILLRSLTVFARKGDLKILLTGAP